MTTSIFSEKSRKPAQDDLREALGQSFLFWESIRKFILDKYLSGIEEWNYPGQKYGWNFRIKDKKRAIAYLLPRDGYFKVAFVFGQKATNLIIDSDISDLIKSELMQARVYAEGRGLQIEIKDERILPDIKKLIEIKLTT